MSYNVSGPYFECLAGQCALLVIVEAHSTPANNLLILKHEQVDEVSLADEGRPSQHLQPHNGSATASYVVRLHGGRGPAQGPHSTREYPCPLHCAF